MSEFAVQSDDRTPVAEPDAIRVENIRKSFGVVTALEDVSLNLRPGEVLGLIGDNGAGKSTLIKILTGFHKPDSGRMFVHGEEVQLKSVTHARSLGIDTVFQDLALVPGLSVYHNMFLNRELTHRVGPLRFLNNRAMRNRSREYLDAIGVRIQSMDAEVARMSGGQRQAIAIARTTHSNATIILLDEPLAAMGAREGALIIELITGAQEARRRLDDRDCAQLRARVRDVRPGQPPPQRPHRVRQADQRDLRRRVDVDRGRGVSRQKRAGRLGGRSGRTQLHRHATWLMQEIPRSTRIPSA